MNAKYVDNKLGQHNKDYIMKPIDYFKLQAKNLLRAYKSKMPYLDEVDGNTYYTYDSKYIDLDTILLEYDWEDERFSSLMKAQHNLAIMLGYKKWADLLKAPEAELELEQLLFNNQDIHKEDWEMYIAGVDRDNGITLDPDARLGIFKRVYLNAETVWLGASSFLPCYEFWKNVLMVAEGRIELPTFGLWFRCSNPWATPPYQIDRPFYRLTVRVCQYVFDDIYAMACCFSSAEMNAWMCSRGWIVDFLLRKSFKDFA